MYTEVHVGPHREPGEVLHARFLAAGYRRVRSVAGYAILGSGLIKQDPFCPNFLERFVTFAAFHVLVSTPQGEGSPLIVVKQGRLPLHAVVAIRARRRVTLGELLSMGVLVALFAEHRCGLEVHIG